MLHRRSLQLLGMLAGVAAAMCSPTSNNGSNSNSSEGNREVTPSQPPVIKSPADLRCTPWLSPPEELSSRGADAGVGCSWTELPGLGVHVGGAVTGLVATASGEVELALAFSPPRKQTVIFHHDGSTWAQQDVRPESASSRLWSSPTGVLWSASSVAGTSGLPTEITVRRRQNGTWIDEPPIRVPNAVVGAITGAADDQVLVLGGIVGFGPAAWRRCGEGWVALPMTMLRPRTFNTGGGFYLDARHIYAFGGSIDGDRPVISAALVLIDGESGREIEIPVPLTEVISMTGYSPNDLYVLGWNRNENGDARLFHVTNELKDWVSVPIDKTQRFEMLARIGSQVIALGCEWPDLNQPAPSDCLRISRIDGPTVERLSDFPRLGRAVAVATTGNDMQLSTFPQTEVGPTAGIRHHRMRCD